jgi:hypothetical protein
MTTSPSKFADTSSPLATTTESREIDGFICKIGSMKNFFE